MSETPESTSVSPPAPAAAPPYWLYRFAAWVVIVAGIVFVVLAIFFTGVWAGHGGYRGHHGHHGHHGDHGDHAMMHGPGEFGPGRAGEGPADGPWAAPGEAHRPGELPPSVQAPPPPGH